MWKGNDAIGKEQNLICIKRSWHFGKAERETEAFRLFSMEQRSDLGAFYSLFNSISFYRYRIDMEKCTKCGK